MIILNKTETETSNEISFTFGNEDENTLELYRNPIGPIYKRDGGKDDLCIKINGFLKIVNNLTIDDDIIKMTFKNG